jgi:hypothetical protein
VPEKLIIHPEKPLCGGPYRLWQYPPRPQATHWVTFDLLRSLGRIDTSGEWQSSEPRTPFQGYARRVKRY